ncbi:hypothetical protein MKZ38_004459 [Zalerion maritima]|uniref:YMC020W-like alpha/beta hydrolase domain-containing protein n=1 Tax=Zalerion maritima TaxID=339359 RepID=A0AAD5RWM7_9PEZI|nr:hypothetical protein MKZ38_004459 [Zalerion maritima]
MGPRKRARRGSTADDTSSGASPAAEASAATAAEGTSQAANGQSTGPNTSLQSTSSTLTVATGTFIPSTTASSSTLSNKTIAATGPAASSPAVNSVRTPKQQVRKTRSWYGSWPRIPKSSASTPVVARESIMGGTSKPPSTPDFTRFETKKPEATPTPDTSLDTDQKPDSSTDAGHTESLAGNGETAAAQTTEEGPDKPVADEATEDDVKTMDSESANNPQRPAPGWLDWFGKAPAKDPGTTAPAVGNEQSEETPKKDGLADSAPPSQPEPETSTANPDDAAEPPSQDQQVPKKSSWFLWPTATSKKTPVQPPLEEPNEPSQPSTVQEPEDVPMEDAPPPTAKPQPVPSAGSTWAFWSRESKIKAKGKEYCPSEHGELAVMGDKSEDHPKPATAVDIENKSPPKEQAQPKSSPAMSILSVKKKTKRARPQSVDVDEPAPERPCTPATESSKAQALSSANVSKSPAASKSIVPNLLLPSFHSTYQMKENPSILRQIAELLLRTRQPPARHVFRCMETPKLKKALAIGVHGLFPASYLRPMIGQPTGTSIKFASHGAEAIRRWAENNGCGDLEIGTVALEGEGKIADRVDNLWRLLLNWIDHIRNADFIMVSCHSQGVPVSVMLVAKLIDLGIVTASKIGICAMAGVSLGPFPDYKSGMGMLMGSAAELWQFSNPDSDIYQRYEHSLKEVLAYGVRITYVGSIDDQLVPMESAVYSPAAHPYIYRAVFIDGRIHAPDFIANLVGFALKLRNLGISDHGLVRELSVPLAGSLYGGEGHSRLYDDGQVYDLAVSHALETTDVQQTDCQVQRHEGLTNPNPYHLPWIMRGLLEEDFVKTELTSETADLLRKFDDWKPSNKALKDVKYRLEAVRSKL